jgi:hypothetical protein
MNRISRNPGKRLPTYDKQVKEFKKPKSNMGLRGAVLAVHVRRCPEVME